MSISTTEQIIGVVKWLDEHLNSSRAGLFYMPHYEALMWGDDITLWDSEGMFAVDLPDRLIEENPEFGEQADYKESLNPASVLKRLIHHHREELDEFARVLREEC